MNVHKLDSVSNFPGESESQKQTHEKSTGMANQKHAKQALINLTERSKSGALIYFVIFLWISYFQEFYNDNHTFWMVNFWMLVLIMSSRVIHIIAVKKYSDSSRVTIFYYWFLTNMMLTASHWGLMTAWVFWEPSMQDSKVQFSLVLPTLALGGTWVLSIAGRVRYLFSILMLSPVLIPCFFLTSDFNSVALLGIILTLGYIFFASRAPHQDYWQAVINRELAEQQANKLARLSVTDQLTQLHNRMHFDTELAKQWQNAINNESPISLLLIDIDRFKQLNDSYGHLFGDKCLKTVAEVIDRSASRANDIVLAQVSQSTDAHDLEKQYEEPPQCIARYGGEEFVALLPETDEEGAKVVAERIRQAIQKIRIHHESCQVFITASIGGATLVPDLTLGSQELIKKSDDALYVAKNAGRNRYAA